MGLVVWLWLALAMLIPVDTPETVLITLHAKRGAEQALGDVLARHYDLVRRLDLVVPTAPHVTLRTTEDEEAPEFVEIFTWKSLDAPDHAPAAVMELWKQMNALVEARGGQNGIEIRPMVQLTPMK